jgi:general stress protein 26
VASKRVEELRGLIEGIETAMFTTRREDGHLVSRPMVTLKHATGADFWFATSLGSDKLVEIENDPHVNLTYFRERTKEWVSVSGLAAASRHRPRIRALYEPSWNAWFPPDADPTHGTADDPRIVLVGVTAHSALFLRSDRPAPLAALELFRGYVTGEQPHVGSVRSVGAAELHARRTAKPT